MNPSELVKLIEILNPSNKPGRITIITRMGAESMRVKLPHLIRAVRNAGLIVTWITDPIHGNTIKAPCGLKTRPFDSILAIKMTNLQVCQHEQFILASPHPPLPCRRADSKSRGSDPEGDYDFCKCEAQDLIQGRWL
ncbi:phospho-2-dehydro-3-deoxyheptonate aldolase 2, chloroplastic-like [Zea mays]|uniref:phospho-2-dehydro-3-deoxyheptonate aldolase 2, chloroplastic-like n=1 Tax=Zea mays TaxID=4577 RepID=UPI0009AA9C08|nr:phospho-2-dehydro-3-deoxyheptonate aldolase 2, chloroplastic-like [Zea mays]|eukprot:XP_020395096.1 phospho-2-dehydro-3-deoxyheptonate aldolase 2, chloroplastic-like [Zea mays]